MARTNTATATFREALAAATGVDMDTFKVGDKVRVHGTSPHDDAQTWEVVKVNWVTYSLVNVNEPLHRIKVEPAFMLPPEGKKASAKKAPEKKTPVKKARKAQAETTPKSRTAQVGDVVTLSDSGARRWSVVKVTAKTLWVDAVRGDEKYTIPHDLVSKVVKAA